MGVQGLWDLVAPAGRRVRPETLEGRVVAVDASIWMVQMLKAMRDSQGNMMRGAHLRGFFRRLCKLLFSRVKPVFIFDGPPPPLKRRTLMERRVLREAQGVNLRKTAEKLLVNTMKQHAVQQVLKSRAAAAAGSAENSPSAESVARSSEEIAGRPGEAATPSAKSDTSPGRASNASQSAAVDSLREINDNLAIDVDVFADSGMDNGQLITRPSAGAGSSEPQAIVEELDFGGSGDEALENATSRRGRIEAYFRGIPDEFRGFLAERRRLDEIQISEASLLSMPEVMPKDVRTGGVLFGAAAQKAAAASSSQSSEPGKDRTLFRAAEDFKQYRVLEEDGVTERFVDLPLDAEIDPEVFASLPPKTQYQILQQLREAWYNHTRLQAVKAKDDMTTFSNVQIESYIRDVRTSKEIEKVKRAMAREVHADKETGPLGAKNEADSSPSFTDGRDDAIAKPPDFSLGDGGGFVPEENSGLFSAARGGVLGQKGVNAPLALSLRADEDDDEDAESKPGKGRGKKKTKFNVKELEKKMVHRPLKMLADEPGLLRTNPMKCWGELKERLKFEENAKNSALAASARKEIFDDKEGSRMLFADDNELFGDLMDVNNADIMVREELPVDELELDEVAHQDVSDEVLQASPPLGRRKIGSRRRRSSPLEASPPPTPPKKRRNVQSTHSGEAEGRGSDGESEVEEEWEGVEFTDVADVGGGIYEGLRGAGGPAEIVNFGNCESDERGRAAGSVGKPTGGDSTVAEDLLRESEFESEKSTLSERPQGTEESTELSEVHRNEVMGNVVISLAGKELPASGEHAPLLSPKTSCTDEGRHNVSPIEDDQEVASEVGSIAEGEIVAVIDDDEDEGRNSEGELVVGTDAMKEKDSSPTEEYLATEKDSSAASAAASEKPAGGAPEPRAAPGEISSSDNIDRPVIEREANREVKRRPNNPLVPTGDAWEQLAAVASGTAQGGETTAESGDRAPAAQAEGSSTSAPSLPRIISAGSESGEPGAVTETKRMTAVGWGGEKVDLKADASPSSSSSWKVSSPVGSPAAVARRARAIVAGEQPMALDVESLNDQLEEEAVALKSDLARQKRDMEHVTPEMQEQIRELLRAFGIPYVDAPAEAEAQAAYLTTIGCCDSVISDDSDTIVFGAKEVFRNFFASDKLIETYDLASVEKNLGLTHHDLMLLSILLGCDYTLGVRGIGVVNALETLKAYPTLEDLRSFRSWAQDVVSFHKSKSGEDEDDTAPFRAAFKRSHRNYRLQWAFPPDFPSYEVIESFRNPTVDRSAEKFSWAPPDVQEIARLLERHAGMPQAKVKEDLNFVLSHLTSRETLVQARLDWFMKPTNEDLGKVASIRSVRMEKAIKTIRGRQLGGNEEPEGPPPKAKPKAKAKATPKGKAKAKATPKGKARAKTKAASRSPKVSASFSHASSA